MRRTKEKKDQIITVRVTKEEKKAIEKRAEKAGKSVSEIIIDSAKKEK